MTRHLLEAWKVPLAAFMHRLSNASDLLARMPGVGLRRAAMRERCLLLRTRYKLQKTNPLQNKKTCSLASAHNKIHTALEGLGTKLMTVSLACRIFSSFRSVSRVGRGGLGACCSVRTYVEGDSSVASGSCAMGVVACSVVASADA
jgi:hypothetical protein